jgi:hypothetical protein
MHVLIKDMVVIYYILKLVSADGDEVMQVRAGSRSRCTCTKPPEQYVCLDDCDSEGNDLKLLPYFIE